MTRRSTPIELIVALLGLIVLAPCAFATIPTPSGADLVRRVLAVQGRVPFEGRQTVVLSTDRGAEATITQEVEYGAGRSSTTYIIPKRAAGRRVVNDGQSRWEYDPAQKTVIRSEILGKQPSAAVIKATVKRLQGSYDLHVNPILAIVNGRPAYELDFVPLHGDRPRRTWWIDTKTSLVLRRDVYDENGRLDQSTTYSNLNFHPVYQPSRVTFVKPPGTKERIRTIPPSVSDWETARHLTTWALVPRSLGQGYEFESARLITVKSAQGIQIEYSDGIIGVSVFEIAGTAHMQSRSAQVHEVAVGSDRGALTQLFPPYRILSWMHEGRTMSLVSELNEKAMVDLGREVQ